MSTARTSSHPPSPESSRSHPHARVAKGRPSAFVRATISPDLALRPEAERDREQALPRAVGCTDCGQTGYAGRVAVVEMMTIDDALRAQIMAGAPPTTLERVALEARTLYSFRRSALQLMARQMISPAEALLTIA